jgi:SAM-dependent methyltransferase
MEKMYIFSIGSPYGGDKSDEKPERIGLLSSGFLYRQIGGSRPDSLTNTGMQGIPVFIAFFAKEKAFCVSRETKPLGEGTIQTMGLFDRFRRKPARQRTLPTDGSIYLTDASGIQTTTTKVPYLLAHDLTEQNRLDFQHFFLKGVLQTNYLAPLNNPSALLDVGSGTGRWIIEMAQQFPSARVTGIDVAPATPSVPLNAQFVQHDILKGLPFPSASFDYVHARLLVAAIPTQAWAGLLTECIRVTQPGGWVELFEGGTTFLNAGPHTRQYLKWWDQISQPRGIDASFMGQLPNWMQQLGFENVQSQLLHVPIGKWGSRAGSMLLANLVSGWGGLKNVFVTQAGVDPTLFDQTFQALPNEWEENRSMYEYVIAIGQVPWTKQNSGTFRSV